jgi:hypothetical protein
MVGTGRPRTGRVNAARTTAGGPLTQVTEVVTFTLVSAEPITGLSGKRYGEVLLVTPGEAGPQAAVYNSFGLNDCPAELWSALDAQAIAAENGAATALLNGPRYWLMNEIEKTNQGPRIIKNFGGIDMALQAQTLLSGMNPAPYTANQVHRHTVFTFDAGEEVYELHDPALRRWVMQTWSQIVDPTLSRADLARLGERLDLPDGWTYQTRTLTSPLRIDTTTHAAQVLQDDLTNSYSLLAG